jgi:hypothetical protein
MKIHGIFQNLEMCGIYDLGKEAQDDVESEVQEK